METNDCQYPYAQLLSMLGAKDHEDAARIIALHHVRDMAHRSTEPTSYFAADPANGEFITQDTLDAAIASAQSFLISAQDDAADYGWPDEPPQICYGVLLGGCVELEGSRKPAPEGSDYDEVVDFRLEPYTAAPPAAGVPDWLVELSASATPGAWRSMREGNQFIDTHYMPTMKCVGASRIDGPKRPWNPHALIAFGFKPEEYEKVRMTDADADFVCALVNWFRSLSAAPEATPPAERVRVPDGWKESGDAALSHMSAALEDLESSPDQRPVGQLREAMHYVRAMLRVAPEAKPHG